MRANDKALRGRKRQNDVARHHRSVPGVTEGADSARVVPHGRCPLAGTAFINVNRADGADAILSVQRHHERLDRRVNLKKDGEQ